MHHSKKHQTDAHGIQFNHKTQNIPILDAAIKLFNQSRITSLIKLLQIKQI